MKKQYEQKMQEDIQQINKTLDRLLPFRGEPYDTVIEAMRYSVMNAGKRIRPVLVLEFCRQYGGDIEDALPFACAVEMIHCYSLIHDDLPCMDDDDLRRGKPSCHKQFGEALALLAGDALLTGALEAMAASPLAGTHPERAVRAIRELAYFSGTDGMVGGQVIDLAIEGQEVAEPLLHQMHRMKTAAIIKAACRMGVICAGAGEDALELAGQYGEYLGLAFQIVDDILDVTADEQVLGKPVHSDQENHKTTYITLFGMDRARELAEDYTEKALEVARRCPDGAFLEELIHALLVRKK